MFCLYNCALCVLLYELSMNSVDALIILVDWSPKFVHSALKSRIACKNYFMYELVQLVDLLHCANVSYLLGNKSPTLAGFFRASN